jgi:hydrogenase maturation protease
MVGRPAAAAKTPRVLFLGYGNPGRLDDGLGAAFVHEVEKINLPGVDAEADYQLSVEDAATVGSYEVVVFVDASVSGTEPFEFLPVKPENGLGFSSHAVKPEGVLALAQELFGKTPEAYLLGIRGYEYNEFGERLSPKAEENLSAAVLFAKEFVGRLHLHD